MSRLKLMNVAVLPLAFLAAHNARPGCTYPPSSTGWIQCGQDSTGHWVKFADQDNIRKVLAVDPAERALAREGRVPSYRVNIFVPAEYLAQGSGAAVLYLGRAEASNAVPLDAVWRGADPLSCLHSFADAAGLEVAVPKPGYWLLGAPGTLDLAAVEVFAYSIDTTLQPLQPEAAVANLEQVLLATLPIRIGTRYHIHCIVC
jgi:hypothetical protein